MPEPDIVVSERTANNFSLAAALGYVIEPFESDVMRGMIVIHRRLGTRGRGSIIKRDNLARWLAERHPIVIGDPGINWANEPF